MENDIEKFFQQFKTTDEDEFGNSFKIYVVRPDQLKLFEMWLAHHRKDSYNKGKVDGAREVVDKLKDPKVAKKIYDLAIKVDKLTKDYQAGNRLMKEFGLPLPLKEQ